MPSSICISSYENSSCRKRSLAHAGQSSGLQELRSRSTAWLRHRRCHWLPTFLTPPGSIFLLAYLKSMKFGFYGHKPSAKCKRIVEVGERSDVLSWLVPLIRSSHCPFSVKSLRLQAFLKGWGTKRAYSRAKRFARLNYARCLVSLSACARWKSLRCLLNALPQVWIFVISYPICTWSMQARKAEGRNSREPWVYDCVLSFFIWSTDKDASSRFLGAHGGKTYQKSF